MSALVHLCRSCAHQQSWHDPPNRGYTSCPCCREGLADPDPEPTRLCMLDALTGIPGPLWAPGTQRNAGTMHASTTCACEGCQAPATAR